MEISTIFRAYNPYKLFKETLDLCKQSDYVLRSIAEGRYPEGVSGEDYEEICQDFVDRELITCDFTKFGVIGETITRKGRQHLAKGGDVALFASSLALKAGSVVGALKP